MARILIVDPDPMVRAMLSETVDTMTGWPCAEAECGACALDRALTERPDLIMLEYPMEGMTGLQLIFELRRREDTAQIPVILHTAWSVLADLMPALRHPLTGLLHKPASIHDIVLECKGLLTAAALRRCEEQLAASLIGDLSRYVDERLPYYLAPPVPRRESGLAVAV